MYIYTYVHMCEPCQQIKVLLSKPNGLTPGPA